MKPSSFNVYIPIENGETIVYNTFSDSRVIVNEELVEAIKSCNQLPDIKDSIKEELSQLIELGIVLNDDVDERKEIEYWIQRVKFDNSSFNVTVLTALACNMKCVYCFEQGVNSSASMSMDTAEALCKWINSKLNEVNPKKLVITFFGGEPLVNVNIVKYLSTTLKQNANKIGIDFGIELITNGLLLNEELVEFLLKCDLEWIKVTLDGDEEIHNQMKPRKNGLNSGTYKEIMNNLQMLKGKVPFILVVRPENFINNSGSLSYAALAM